VRVVNINPGGNTSLLSKSATLNGYSAFVERVRSNQRSGMKLRGAIREAIDWSISAGALADFMDEHKSEVESMLYTEFNINTAKKVWQEESFADGFSDGSNERAVEIAKNALEMGMQIDTIIKLTGLTREEVESLHKAQ